MSLRCFLFTLRDIDVVVCKAYRIPEGIKPAFATIKARLSRLEKRQVFGLTYAAEEEPEYYAAVEVYNHKDAARFDLPRMVIPGGRYARALLPPGTTTPARVAATFREMQELYPFDRWRPKIEFLRPPRRPHLYLPIKAA